MQGFKRIVGAAVVSLLAGVAAGQQEPIAFVGATIIPIDGQEIEGGILIVHEGKIEAVGSAAAMTIPADMKQVDVRGKVIMPGLVDTHSHIGGVGGADGSATIQPQVRVMDSINVFDSGFRRAVAGGLTTLNVMPGSGHLLSGQTVYLKLRDGVTRIEEMTIKPPEGSNLVSPLGGMKMANGTNPLRDPPFSGTRGKSAAMMREQLIKAQEYKAKLGAAGDDESKKPARDLAMEGLVEVLEGRRMVHHHTHRADDIMTVLRLKKEFGFRVVLHHVSEAWKVADEIAEAGVGCSAIVIDSPGGKLEAVGLSLETGKALEEAGAEVAFHTDDWITDSRLFLRSAALAVRAGMSREAALKALTQAGADMMDMGDRVGSLTAGKDADFIILSGDPLSVYTKVEQTWVEGVKVFDRSDPEDRLFAVGGFGAGNDQEPYMCCASGAQAFGSSGTVWQFGGANAGGGNGGGQ